MAAGSATGSGAAINALADETRFSIIGQRGEAADFVTDRLGFDRERAVRTSSCPVMIVPREFRPIKRFLFAFEGGASSLRALDRLVEGSVLDGLECHLFTVGDATDERG